MKTLRQLQDHFDLMENINTIRKKVAQIINNLMAKSAILFSTEKVKIEEVKSTYQPEYAHFVGSVPLSSNAEVFTKLSEALPGRLVRLPDGETGKRWNYVGWQHETFAANPQVIRQLGLGSVIPDGTEKPDDKILVAPVGYDDMALESYAEFCKLRSAGVIEKGVKFQVSLPSPLNTIAICTQAPFQAEAEKVYEPKLLDALRRIQDNIPAGDLAIQWDLAIEVLMLETVPYNAPYWQAVATPWFSPLKEGIMERLERITKVVRPDVEIGYHICYGDLFHVHFANPKDMGLLVEVANMLPEITDRKINWIHMPVPKDRADEAYFAPLKDLKLKGNTEIILGLVHGFDEEGTRKKIEVASHFLDKFSVATECGCGREAKDEWESVLGILGSVTTGVKKATV